MSSLLGALYLALTLQGPAVSPSPPVQSGSSYELPIREHLMANGLRVLVLERAGDHRVAAKIFTDFGSIVEEPGELGAAHFLEHLMFKGTPTLGTIDWDAEKPLIDRINATEEALNDELNRERNTLRERGVFHDYAHQRSTPRIDSLRAEIGRLNTADQQYRRHGAMMRWYQAFGGQRLTATTEQEYMKFDINLPAERVELFFRLEADRMKNSVFREFDQERMILVEQRIGDLNRETTPYYEQMNAAVGVVHPVFWPEGYLTDFDQYTRAYQRDLYERYFVPNNTTLVLIGGVQFDRMVELADKYFGHMEPSPLAPTRARAVEPLPQAERRVIYRSDAMAPRVEARFQIPGVGHPERPLFDVLAEVAEREIREALAGAGIVGTVDVNTRVVHETLFGVPSSINFEVIVPVESQLAAAETVLLATLDVLGRETVDDDQLRLAKKRLRMEWFDITVDMDRLAFQIGHFQTMDHWRTLTPYLMARDATTPAEIAGAVRKYFVPDNRTIGVVRSRDGTMERE